MKIKVKDLRKLIRENFAREIPQHAVDEIFVIAVKMDPKKASSHCCEKLQHHMMMHINSTSASQADMRQKIGKMHMVLRNMEEEIRELKSLKDELRDVIEQSIRRFLFI